MICSNCNAKNDYRNDKCINCHQPLYNNQYTGYNAPAPSQVNINYNQYDIYNNSSYRYKNQIVAFLLCLFFGVFGAHRFYVNKVGSAILYICTMGLFGIGWLIDLVMILLGVFKDKNNMPVIG